MAMFQALSDSPFDIEIEHWSYTPMKTTKINYTWVIDNFDSQTASISSPNFSIGVEGRTFSLSLVITDVNRENDNGYYSLRINLPYGYEIGSTEMKSTFSIVDYNGKKTKTIQRYETVKPGITSLTPVTFIAKRDLIADKDKLLPDGRLTLFCEMTVIAEGAHVSGQTKTTNKIPKSNLPEVLEGIFENKMHCDVQFIVGPEAQKIQAHKAILTARSSVFRATFENEMKESKNNQVVVDNFSPVVFTEMLRFIYTDRVGNLDDMASDLLIIANYYDLERLRIMCEDSLYRNLTVENAAETLLLADLHNSNTLKLRTQNFIQKYAKQFTKSAGFQTMEEKYPELAMMTLKMLTNNPMISPVLSEVDHLLLNAELSDITLVVEGEELRAHKLVLATQSPIFAEKFKGPSSTPNRLVIEDIQSLIMKEVLAYFYTGQLREAHDVDILLKVLAVAETYQIKKLKALCVNKLWKKLAIDTVVPILIEADDYNVPELSKKAFDFIQTNKEKILILDNFKQLCNKKPELLFKILALDIKK